MDITSELFKGKSFSDILKDIHDNSKKKDRQINLLIAELKPLIKNIGDATIIVPLIKEYLDISVRNDEHLVKLAAVAQRLMTAAAKSNPEAGDYALSDAEKEQLLREIESIEKGEKFVNNTMTNIKKEHRRLVRNSRNPCWPVSEPGMRKFNTKNLKTQWIVYVRFFLLNFLIITL